jgi:excisionase family DNA binding protein
MAQNTQATVLLSTNQVAERLSVHQKTVFKWLAQGKLRAVRFGARCTRFRESDIEAFIATGTVSAPASTTNKTATQK